MKTPREYQEARDQFTALHSHALEALEKIWEFKPAMWAEIRKTVNSDKAADRAWEGTDLGIKEMKLKTQVKRLEKEISAAASALNLLNTEARNQF
jgi:hypothetical protein